MRGKYLFGKRKVGERGGWLWKRLPLPMTIIEALPSRVHFNADNSLRATKFANLREPSTLKDKETTSSSHTYPQHFENRRNTDGRQCNARSDFLL